MRADSTGIRIASPRLQFVSLQSDSEQSELSASVKRIALKVTLVPRMGLEPTGLGTGGRAGGVGVGWVPKSGRFQPPLPPSSESLVRLGVGNSAGHLSPSQGFSK